MTRSRSGFDWIPGDNIAILISGMAIFSSAAIVFSVVFRDFTTAIAGTLGFALVALGVVAWGSGRSIRRAVADLRNDGSVAWPVYARSDRDARQRRGFIRANEKALDVTLGGETIRIEWPDIAAVNLQASQLFKSGRVLVMVPTRGTMMLEILSRNAVTSLNDSELLECTKILNGFKLETLPPKTQ
jgi:hypothetical protein